MPPENNATMSVVGQSTVSNPSMSVTTGTEEKLTPSQAEAHRYARDAMKLISMLCIQQPLLDYEHSTKNSRNKIFNQTRSNQPLFKQFTQPEDDAALDTTEFPKAMARCLASNKWDTGTTLEWDTEDIMASPMFFWGFGFIPIWPKLSSQNQDKKILAALQSEMADIRNTLNFGYNPGAPHVLPRQLLSAAMAASIKHLFSKLDIKHKVSKGATPRQLLEALQVGLNSVKDLDDNLKKFLAALGQQLEACRNNEEPHLYHMERMLHLITLFNSPLQEKYPKDFKKEVKHCIGSMRQENPRPQPIPPSRRPFYFSETELQTMAANMRQRGLKAQANHNHGITFWYEGTYTHEGKAQKVTHICAVQPNTYSGRVTVSHEATFDDKKTAASLSPAEKLQHSVHAVIDYKTIGGTKDCPTDLRILSVSLSLVEDVTNIHQWVKDYLAKLTPVGREAIVSLTINNLAPVTITAEGTKLPTSDATMSVSEVKGGGHSPRIFSSTPVTNSNSNGVDPIQNLSSTG